VARVFLTTSASGASTHDRACDHHGPQRAPRFWDLAWCLVTRRGRLLVPNPRQASQIAPQRSSGVSAPASWNQCEAAGHPSLAKLGRGTVSKILSANQVHPHKIRYYLERRDPEFEAKMVQVLHVYKEVEIWREKGVPPPAASCTPVADSGMQRSKTVCLGCPRRQEGNPDLQVSPGFLWGRQAR